MEAEKNSIRQNQAAVSGRSSAASPTASRFQFLVDLMALIIRVDVGLPYGCATAAVSVTLVGQMKKKRRAGGGYGGGVGDSVTIMLGLRDAFALAATPHAAVHPSIPTTTIIVAAAAASWTLRSRWRLSTTAAKAWTGTSSNCQPGTRKEGKTTGPGCWLISSWSWSWSMDGYRYTSSRVPSTICFGAGHPHSQIGYYDRSSYRCAGPTATGTTAVALLITSR
ncbi:hypothetical protein ONZ45_g10364 [Pleurotus djamor]|nr:hypothetical protein ONZ45_g10364 [Pleurotus djamor]